METTFNYFLLVVCSIFAVYCWNESEKHETWSGRWWYDLFCSALNGVCAINIGTKLFS